MKEFLFLFRVDYLTMKQLSPEALEEIAKKAKNWVTAIAAQNKLADKGNRLIPGEGSVVRDKMFVTDGPYVETKEAVNGYLIIKADTMDEAVKIAQGNPMFALDIGGSIEVREINTL